MKLVLEQAQQPDFAQAFGLPKPLSCGISEVAIKARVDVLYASVYSKLDAKLAADAAALEKSKAADVAKEEAVIQKTPGELPDKLVHKSATESSWLPHPCHVR